MVSMEGININQISNLTLHEYNKNKPLHPNFNKKINLHHLHFKDDFL